MKRFSSDAFKSATLSLTVNLLYAGYNGVLGTWNNSRWFVISGAYYVILSIMRFSAVLCAHGSKAKDNQVFIMRFSGVMFLLLSMVLSALVYLTIKDEVGTKYHEIVMITIATYTFTKITLAIVNFIKSGKKNSPIIITLRSISVADGAVSIFSMQRSMLTSFDGMSAQNITLFNLLTGIGVCIIIIILGIYMIRKDIRKWQNLN